MEPYDPTLDEMMCFYKAPLQPIESKDPNAQAARLTPSDSFCSAEEERPEAMGDSLQLPEQLSAFLQGAPQVLLQTLRDSIDGLIDTLPQAVVVFKEKIQVFSRGQQLVAQTLIDQTVEPFLVILQKLRPLFQQAEVGKIDSSPFEFIPGEVLLLVPALMRKVEKGNASPNELFAAAIIQDMDVMGFRWKEYRRDLEGCEKIEEL